MAEETFELERFLEPFPNEVQALTLQARRRLHELVGPATDLFFDATQAVCAGLSYTGDPRDNFLNLAVYSDHVTLVFPWGVKLDDPDGLLRGSGSQVRHFRLSSVAELDNPRLGALISQASEVAKKPEGGAVAGKYVKVYNGPKRRPLRA